MGRACWGGAGRRAASLCAGAQTRGWQRPADAGVCSSRSGGGTSDNKTLPEYSPRPACDGGACWPVSPLSPWLPAPRHTHTQSRSSGRAIKHHTRTQHSVWASPQSRSARLHRMRVAGNTLEASCCRTCRRRCAKRRLRRLLAAADHASGLPRATTLRVDLRLPSTPSPLVMTCFSAQSLGRLFASPAQVVGAAQHSDDVTCSWPAHPRGPARPHLTRPPPPVVVQVRRSSTGFLTKCR